MSSDRHSSPPGWALAPFLVAAALGCADFSRGGPAMDTGEAADAGASTSLIFSGNAATDYTTVLQFVATAAPASSRILSKVSGNGHGGGTIYAAGTTQYETILAWIQQGAPP